MCTRAGSDSSSHNSSSSSMVVIGYSSCTSEDEDEFFPQVDPTKNPSEEHEHTALWMWAPEGAVDSCWLDECRTKEFENTGKWLLFYRTKLLDKAWHRAKDLLASGELPGVIGIETTTANPGSYALSPNYDPEQGVLKFYGGSPEDEAGTRQLGEMILSKMNYHGTGRIGSYVRWGYVYWKSHAATQQGRYSSSSDRVSKFRLSYEPWQPEKILQEAGFDTATIEQLQQDDEKLMKGISAEFDRLFHIRNAEKAAAEVAAAAKAAAEAATAARAAANAAAATAKAAGAAAAAAEAAAKAAAAADTAADFAAYWAADGAVAGKEGAKGAAAASDAGVPK